MKLAAVLQTYGLVHFARESWKGRAVLRTGAGNTMIESGGAKFPFAFTFEDVVADDWVVTERRL